MENKFVLCTSLEQMFKHAATDRHTQPTTKHQKLTCAIKDAWKLLDGCCCLSNTDNEIPFRITISPPFKTMAGLDVAGLWLGHPGYRTSNQWTSSHGAQH